MTFKNCPICGKKLTWDENVHGYDDEGEECLGSGTNLSERTYAIVLSCDCGFSFACNEAKVGFIIDPKWSEKFEALANRRGSPQPIDFKGMTWE